MRPSPGDLLIIDGRASVQFAGDRALTLRVVSVCDRPTYHGWVWLTGYVINRAGRATAKREVYVQLAGLRRAPAVSAPARQGQRQGHPRPYALRHDQQTSGASIDRSALAAGHRAE